MISQLKLLFVLTGHVNLFTESESLQQDLLKVEQLEGKVMAEMNSLKEKIQQMSEGLIVYRDLDALKAAGEQKKQVTVHIYTRTCAYLPFHIFCRNTSLHL